MNSATASGLMVEMVERAAYGYHETQVSVWETFRLLRGEGYSPESIYNLLKLKHQFRTHLAKSDGHRPFSPEAEHALAQFESLVTGGKAAA